MALHWQASQTGSHWWKVLVWGPALNSKSSLEFVCSSLTGEQTHIHPNVLFDLFICQMLLYGKTHHRLTCIT